MPELRDLSFEQAQALQEELEQGETLRWATAPDPRCFARQARPMVWFGIPWTAFAVFWMYGAAGFKIPSPHSEDLSFVLFGVPFVLIGLGLLTSPLWMRRHASRTVYALTDRRALILTFGWTRKVRSFAPHRLGDLTRREFADGSGDLVFGRDLEGDAEGSSLRPYGFLGVPDVREVEALVRQLVTGAP